VNGLRAVEMSFGRVNVKSKDSNVNWLGNGQTFKCSEKVSWDFDAATKTKQ